MGPAGHYRVLAESALGNDVELTGFVRAAVPPTLVPFADAVRRPPHCRRRRFHQGNTANAAADFGRLRRPEEESSTPDQMLALQLSAKKRHLRYAGTAYASILDPPRDTCPELRCPVGLLARGISASRSYLDLTPRTRKYWVQVDGWRRPIWPVVSGCTG